MSPAPATNSAASDSGNSVENPNNTIVIIGFQAEHTLGRRIVERRPYLKIYDREYTLRAKVEILNGLSGHADVNDFKDIASIFHSYGFDYVFHYAAMVGVKRTLAHPVMVLNDIKGFNNILNLAKNSGVKRMFYSSSSEVYGEPVEYPQNEHTTPLNSRLPYAIVKNVGEAYLRSYKKEFDKKRNRPDADKPKAKQEVKGAPGK